jgi:hypothetical protein
MAPLQPPKKLKIPSYFFQIDASTVASFSNQPPNPIPFDLEPLFNVDMWIFVEETKKKQKDYELNRVFQDV